MHPAVTRAARGCRHCRPGSRSPGHPSDLLDNGGQLTVWRYRRTASGAKTAVIAADQTSASRTWPVTVWPGGRAPWPRNRPRRALVVTVTGWLTLLAYSGLCGQGEFEVGEVAG